MPEVSVIVPLYNKAKYIARTMDSVFAQTFEDYEVIVVDDGSTDDGAAIVERYKDPRLRLIRQENAGPGAARNRGIRESSAPLLTFLDADDEWMPEFLEKTVRWMEENPDCPVVAAEWFCQRNDPEHRVRMYRALGVKEGKWRLPKGAGYKGIKAAVVFFGNRHVLYQREVVERFGGFYEHHCLLSEDQYLFVQVILNYQIYRRLEALAFHDLSASELYMGRRRKGLPLAVSPMVSDPEQIRRNCPAEYRGGLEEWLAYRALKCAHNQIIAGKNSVAQDILKRFPLVKHFRLRHIGIKTDMISSSLIKSVTPFFWTEKLLWRMMTRRRRKKYSAR